MNNLNNIIIFAFRYGLHKNTGAPLMISNFIKKNINALTFHDVKEIISDIEREEQLSINISEDWLELKLWLIEYIKFKARS